jgi:hypothetical protein
MKLLIRASLLALAGLLPLSVSSQASTPSNLSSSIRTTQATTPSSTTGTAMASRISWPAQTPIRT